MAGEEGLNAVEERGLTSTNLTRKENVDVLNPCLLQYIIGRYLFLEETKCLGEIILNHVIFRVYLWSPGSIL